MPYFISNILVAQSDTDRGAVHELFSLKKQIQGEVFDMIYTLLMLNNIIVWYYIRILLLWVMSLWVPDSHVKLKDIYQRTIVSYRVALSL